MNIKSLVPIEFSRKTTPFVAGDLIWNEIDKMEFKIRKGDHLSNFNDDEDKSYDNWAHLYVISYADRPNTGEQPVDDDVIVDATFKDVDEPPAETGSAIIYYFGDGDDAQNSDMITWKPNHAAMVRAYQDAKQDERMNNIARNGNDWHHYDVVVIGDGVKEGEIAHDDGELKLVKVINNLADVTLADKGENYKAVAAITLLETIGYTHDGKGWKPPLIDVKKCLREKMHEDAIRKLLYVCDGMSQEYAQNNFGEARNWMRQIDKAYQSIEDVASAAITGGGNSSERMESLKSEPKEKPVYTQAMCDAGEFAVVGMIANYGAHISVEILKIRHNGSFDVAAYMITKGADEFNVKWCALGDIEPLQTDEDKLRDKVIELLGQHIAFSDEQMAHRVINLIHNHTKG